MNLRCLEACLVQANFIIGVVGVCGVRFEVIIDGSVVILRIQRLFCGRIVLFALWAARCKDANKENEEKLTAAMHELSGIPTGRNPRLYLPLQSSIGLVGAASRLPVGVAHWKLFHLSVLLLVSENGPTARPISEF